MRVVSAVVAAIVLLAPAVAVAQDTDSGKDATPTNVATEVAPPASPFTITGSAALGGATRDIVDSAVVFSLTAAF